MTDAAAYLPYLPQVAARWLATSPDTRHRRADCSLVFADVSGFTPLTERLARRGKVGAEELTDVLNDVFSRLLAAAGDLGGDLLKFGGDALLLLFEGNDHALRSASAARRLLAELRPFRRLRTAGGTVSLSMSIGMDSGPVDLFLVGGSSRELLVAGPVVSSTVAMEHAAQPGEVRCGPGSVGWLPAGCTEPRETGHLLTRALPMRPGGPGAPDPALTASRAELGVPVGLREHLACARAHGEHRLAALSFLQFTGSDELLAAQGPQALADALDTLVVGAQRACERFGVTFLATDVDCDGGKILFSAGAPSATHDDADRLLHALLSAVRTDSPLRLRAGANWGRAFAVDVGSHLRRTYAVMGDATNLAARVMGRAGRGEVVVTRALLDRCTDSFDERVLAPFLVKGKSQPVDAAVVMGALGRRGRGSGLELPFFGRTDEVGVLADAVQGARTGRGRRVRVVGEPGIGKSRLVSEMLRRADGLATVVVEAGQYSADTPYFCLRAPLRRLVGVDAHASEADTAARLAEVVEAAVPDVQRWLPLLAVPWGCALADNDATRTLDPANRRGVLAAAVRRLLDHLLSEPTLLVVEDGQWVDEASAELLDRLADGIDQLQRSVIVTRRPGPGGFGDSDGWTELRLARLPEEDAAEALAEMVEAELSPVVRAELVRRSGGNPLFLRELVAAAARGEVLEALPESVEGLLAAAIDELPPDERDLLRAASVLGVRFRPALLDALLADRPGAAAQLTARLPRYVALDADGSVRFEHALIRDVAYEALSFRRRRELHARAGTAVAGLAGGQVDDVVELLSLHFHLAEDHQRAWQYSTAAGERAVRSSAVAEAAVFYRRALDASRHLNVSADRLRDLCERLGDALEVCGRYEEASAAYRQAYRLADDVLVRVGLLKRQGWVRERATRYSDALRWYTRAMKTLSTAAPGLATDTARAQLAMSYGAARLRQGRYSAALPLLREALAVSERTSDWPTAAHTYYLLDWALTDLGSAERHAYRDRALEIYERTGDLVGQGFALNNLGIDAYWEGRWEDALTFYRRAGAVCERTGDVITEATTRNNIGEILSDQGHFDAAGRHFRDALATMRTGRSFPVGIAIVTSNLGRLAARLGDVDAAQSLLADARARFTAIGSVALACETDAREAERLLFGGEVAHSRAVAEAARSAAIRIGGLRSTLAMLERLTALADALDGDVLAAAHTLAAAYDHAATEHAWYEAAMTRRVEAAVAAARGDAGTAEALLLAAGGLADRLGIVGLPPALLRLLDRLAAASARSGPPGAPAPREAHRPAPVPATTG